MNEHQRCIKRFQLRRGCVYLSTHVYIFMSISISCRRKPFNFPDNYILGDNHCSTFCGNNFQCTRASTCKEAVSNTQYQYSHYIFIHCTQQQHCLLHSTTTRVYLMQRFCISQTRCERRFHSCQYSVVKFWNPDTQIPWVICRRVHELYCNERL